jgi:hypothetical protein
MVDWLLGDYALLFGLPTPPTWHCASVNNNKTIINKNNKTSICAYIVASLNNFYDYKIYFPPIPHWL